MASDEQPEAPPSEAQPETGANSTEQSVTEREPVQINSVIQETQTAPTPAASPKAEPPPPSNPRLQALSTKKTTLERTLADLQSQKSTLVASSTLPSGLAMPSTWTDEEKATSALATANARIKDHIQLLHRYNEVKDIAQGLMGLIAETRGVRQKVVEEEFGVGEGD